MSTSEIINGSRDPENSLGWPLNMRPKEASQYTGVSESTLAKLRMLHKRAKPDIRFAFFVGSKSKTHAKVMHARQPEVGGRIQTRRATKQW